MRKREAVNEQINEEKWNIIRKQCYIQALSVDYFTNVSAR